jgi:hypothetical protein
LLIIFILLNFSAHAALSEADQNYIFSEINAGRVSVIDYLTIDGATFEEGRVDATELVHILREGDSLPLTYVGFATAKLQGVPSPNAFLNGKCGNMGGCYCSDGHGVPWNANCSWGRSNPQPSSEKNGCRHVGQFVSCY